MLLLVVGLSELGRAVFCYSFPARSQLSDSLRAMFNASISFAAPLSLAFPAIVS